MGKVAFIGAGSVEFTRNLVTDLCSLPRAARAAWSSRCTTSTRTASTTPRRMTRRIIEQTVAGATVTSSLDRLRRDRRAPTTSSTRSRSAGTRPPAPTSTSRAGTACGRRSRTPSASAASSAGCARSRCVVDLATDMAELCPDAYLLNYSNPMAMLPWAVYAGIAVRPGRRACATRVRDTHGFLAGLVGMPSTTSTSLTAGFNHQAFVLRFEHAGRGPVPAAARGHRRGPRSASAGSASRSSGGSGTSRPSPASTRPSTCRGSCATTTRWSSSASSSATISTAPTRTSRSTQRTKRELATDAPLELEVTSRAGLGVHRRPSRRGGAGDLRQRAQRRPDLQPAGGLLRGGPVRWWTRTGCTRGRSARFLRSWRH